MKKPNTNIKNKKAVITLAGSPNVGKSTVFNALTGLNQHTGNWTGKTVSTAAGTVKYKGCSYLLVDIPGTYSLCPRSAEEEVARDFICFGESDGIIVVCDALCLERNMSLVLQIAEYTSKIVLCINLIDEADKKGICYDYEKLSSILNIPVVTCSAKHKRGLDVLMEKTVQMLDTPCSRPIKIPYAEALENAIDKVSRAIKEQAPELSSHRFFALKMLSGDDTVTDKFYKYTGILEPSDSNISKALVSANNLLEEQGLDKDKINDLVSESIQKYSAEILKQCAVLKGCAYARKDKITDKILTGKFTAFPVMLIMLAFIFWLTITGANYPSRILSDILFSAENTMYDFFAGLGAPKLLCDVIFRGIYRVLSWVVSVMLPPMAIFFPLFTLLEDMGFLPRIAYNLDKCFARCNACGKQALTMCMGFGCNACGVVGCRIIDSPRERLIAVLTNSFVPCNGRFPLLITIISLFFITGTGIMKSLSASLILVAVITIGIICTFLASKLLSSTLLKGEASAFVLEMPPYRMPNIVTVLVRSFLDRTLIVLSRAVTVAAPAGLIIWIMANTSVGNMSVLSHVTGFFDPFARLFGLDGVIFTSFILALPANEIVIPIMIMAYSHGSVLTETGISEMFSVFSANGWTDVTAICVMLFSLMHFPCATTLMTIKKETGSIKWTLVSAILPTVFGLVLCFVVNCMGEIWF